ncbi:MAG: hypothetical protein CME63_16910 [Halobacteriovoraceae bacterium]|nr:hypothetical protein [Halobacteriovoraceae bacterium]MBC99426.1 hypothetical protein [Halobacteriovoraceae bacterium]|tara:strand:- start:56775 stop:57299 length:525 start_codon:yes stop_codon:yes gene_type:complete
MRNKRFNIRKSTDKELDVDITSLLDILVILLVFLLKSYNASDLKLEVAKNIELPKSKSMTLGNMAVIVQVSGEKDIWINNKKIGRYLASEGEKIEVLYSALEEEGKKQDNAIKELETTQATQSDKGALATRKANRKRVNIVMDQSLPYEVLRRVMHTSAMAGFPEFKFIVQGNF